MNDFFFSYEQMIAEISKLRGYTPFLETIGTDSALPLSPNVAIVRPTTINKKVGSERCRISSVLTFVLVKNSTHMSPVRRSSLWREMRCDALNIICEVEKDPFVLSLSAIDIAPCIRKGAKNEEVALKVCATIISNYDATRESFQLV